MFLNFTVMTLWDVLISVTDITCYKNLPILMGKDELACKAFKVL